MLEAVFCSGSAGGLARVERRFSMPWSRRAAVPRVHPGSARHLGLVAARHPAGFRWRLIPAHLDDPGLRPRPAALRPAQSAAGRGRHRYEPRGGRNGRRPAGARLHDAELSGPGHPAHTGRGPGQSGSAPAGLSGEILPVRGDRLRWEGAGRGRGQSQGTNRLLRVNPFLPSGAGAPQVGRPADRAEPAGPPGRVAGDGRPDRRRSAGRVRPGGAAPGAAGGAGPMDRGLAESTPGPPPPGPTPRRPARYWPRVRAGSEPEPV